MRVTNCWNENYDDLQLYDVCYCPPCIERTAGSKHQEATQRWAALEDAFLGFTTVLGWIPGWGWWLCHRPNQSNRCQWCRRRAQLGIVAAMDATMTMTPLRSRFAWPLIRTNRGNFVVIFVIHTGRIITGTLHVSHKRIVRTYNSCHSGRLSDTGSGRVAHHAGWSEFPGQRTVTTATVEPKLRCCRARRKGRGRG
jgi:hypothetical protein